MQSTVQDSDQAECALLQTEDVEEAYHDGAPEPSGMEFPPDGAAENSHHGTSTDRSHMQAASQNWRQPLNFVSSGAPKLSKDPIGLLLVLSEEHKRIAPRSRSKKNLLIAESHIHCNLLVSANELDHGKFHLQVMHLQDATKVQTINCRKRRLPLQSEVKSEAGARSRALFVVLVSIKSPVPRAVLLAAVLLTFSSLVGELS